MICWHGNPGGLGWRETTKVKWSYRKATVGDTFPSVERNPSTSATRPNRMEHSSIACGLSLLRGASLVGTTLMSGLNRMPCGHLIRQPRASAILHGCTLDPGSG